MTQKANFPSRPLYLSMSPSYGSTLAQQIHIGTVNSFDLESADELGILGNKFPSKPNSVITDISSQKVLTAAAAAATLPPLIHDDHHNTMNGLFKNL